MSISFDATIVARDGTTRRQSFDIRRMYNFGSATRDPESAVAHQQEVAKSGIHIAFDVPAPRIYPIALHALTFDDELYVQSDRTSGEVEIVVLVADQLYVGVGSDHTDRLLETVSIPGSKQACANHLAPVFWPYEEMREAWDGCTLRSWVDGRLYQEVGVDTFLAPEDVVRILRERAAEVPERDFLIYCGTYVSVDKELGYGAHWRYELEGDGRSIGADYRVVDILGELRPEFRVPFFNPVRGA